MIAFVVTVDDSGMWSAAQIDTPAVGMTPSGVAPTGAALNGMWLHNNPLNLSVSGFSYHYRGRLASFEEALAWLRERVAGEAAKLLGKGGQP